MEITKRGFGVRHLVRITLLGGMAIALAGPSVGADKFPRLGMISTGGPQRYASSFQTYASKYNVVIIGGTWEGWQKGTGYSKQTVISNIKAQSHVSSRVFQYVQLNSLYNSSYAGSNGFPTFYKQVVARKWWLYPTGTSGTPVPDPQSSQRWLVNMGPNVPVDPTTGLGPYAWAAKFVDDLFHLGRYAGTSAAPSLDGFFLDNTLIDPSNGSSGGNGDWQRNYTTQAHNAATTYNNLMAGQKQFFSYLDRSWPGSQQLGNVGGTYALALSSYYSKTAPTLNSQILSATSPFSGVMEGGALEHALGRSFSIETWGGSAALQQWYRTALANVGGAKLMLLSHGSVTANGSDPVTFSGSTVTSWSPAYQGMRYGLCAALMNNGYYAPDSGTYDEETTSNRRWFDEFDNAGRGGGYLGNPVTTAAGYAQTTSWSNGVWKREFQGGVVLWNPKGSGTRTVNVSTLKSPSGHTGLKHILGSQNPSLNNGAWVSSVTLRDRDGVILLWATP